MKPTRLFGAILFIACAGNILPVSSQTFPGPVSIGTISTACPTAVLDVGGDININPVTDSYQIGCVDVLTHQGGTSNIFVGVGAGANNAGANRDNTYVGSNAGFLGTGLPGNEGNTFVGSSAGFNNIQNYHTFVGYQAGILQDCAACEGNTYIGAFAGWSATFAGENVFVGYEAGRATDQSGNTFVGYQCGDVNVGGYSNSFFGAASGGSNIDGIENSFFGSVSGSSNIDGLYNCFFGRHSGASNESGSYNSFYGTRSGANVSIVPTVNYNSFFGYESGNASAGQENTFLGANSGYQNSGDNNFFGSYNSAMLNTGSDNIGIGVNSANANAGNLNIMLGNSSGASNTGDENIMMGLSSGTGNTGDWNILLGSSAGSSNSGNHNFFGGLNSAQMNTGNGNIAIGINSGNANGGDANILLGNGSGSSNTGDENIIMGQGSGTGNTGNWNVIMGSSAGIINTGEKNVFIGFNSAIANVAGRNNAFVGSLSGAGNLNGSNNAFFGVSAGSANTTGSSNVAVGASSGANNATGINNTSLGTNSGIAGGTVFNFTTTVGANSVARSNNVVILGGRVNSTYDLVGIGLSNDYVNNGPTEMLEINTPAGLNDGLSPGITPGNSGLKFRDLTWNSTIQPNGGNMGVLTVDGSGKVIYVAQSGGIPNANNGLSVGTFMGTNYVQLGQNPVLNNGTGPAILLNNREIPMNNFNLVFTDPTPGIGTLPNTNSIGVGLINPMAKLDVERNNITAAGRIPLPIAIRGVNHDVSSQGANSSIGIQGLTDGNNYNNWGGHFTATNSCNGIGVGGYATKGNYAECNNFSRTKGGEFFGMEAANFNYGVYSVASNSVPGTNSENNGGWFKAFNGNVANYGVQGDAENTYASSTGVNAGGWFDASSASSSTINYGVTGKVAATGGVDNYGGYFESVGGQVNYGMRGIVVDAAANDNFGGQFIAREGSNSNIGIESTAENIGTSGSNNIAGHFEASGATFNIGVKGISLDPSSNSNYGGIFEVDPNGTGTAHFGVYAIGPVDNPGSPGGFAAGLFNGDLETVQGFYAASDMKLKTNITPISEAMGIINRLNPVTYQFKTEEYPGINLSEKSQWGLISQEVEKVLPELVKEMFFPAKTDSMGNVIYEETHVKGLNYTQLIPILLKGIQEQNTQIGQQSEQIEQQNQQIEQLQTAYNDLSRIVTGCCATGQVPSDNNGTSGTAAAIDVTLSNTRVIILDENVPNPFAENTTIGYQIPETVVSAKLVFTDNAGQVLKEVEITERGRGQVNVFGQDLSSGTYTYSLYIDGQLYESKRMIKLGE